MEDHNPNPDPLYTTSLIIWLSLFVSQFLFVVILYFTKPELFRFDFMQPLLGDNAAIVAALGFISITNILVSIGLRKKYLAQAVAEQNVGLVQTAMIIGCALTESASLFGLILGAVFGYQYFFVFSAIGIVGTTLHFPRRESVHAASYKPQIR